jgi:hypothetical protein
MYCENCGHPIPDGARFCDSCGTPLIPAGAAHPEEIYENTSDDTMIPPMPEAPDASSDASGKRKQKKKMKQKAGGPEPDVKIEGRRVTENICLCPDGKYRWIYEYEMLKNPTILITVMKGLLLSFGIVAGFMVLINLIGGDFRYWNRSDYLSFFKGFLIFLLVMLALGAVSYLILAAIYGWSYQVLLTMDEDGVELRQMKKDFQKSQAIGWLTAAAGLATGNIGRVGTGILAATRDSSTSVFQHVRKVKAVRSRHVIYVNQVLGHNQVYAEEADFDFVRNFIVEHCPNAKISG